MMQYSPEMLNLFGGPELSNLTVCGAKELPALSDYLEIKTGMNRISGVPSSPDPAVHHLDLVFVRRAHAAAEEYRLGRDRLLRYVEGVVGGTHLFGAYLSALMHFEQCLGAIWQAAELLDRMEKKVRGDPSPKMTRYKPGDGSDLERINLLNNVAKHFNASQAQQTSTPVWITNHGIKGSGGLELSFDELYENVLPLSKAARVAFVEIPQGL
jgi:hypothetical protein